MNKTTVYLVPQDTGDGSVSIQFMESNELAKWHEEHDDEPFADSCVDTISFTSEAPLQCVDEIETKESYFLRLVTDYEPIKEDVKDFIQKFFPDGAPIFRIALSTERKPFTSTYGEPQDYVYFDIFIGENRIGTQMYEAEKAEGEILTELNKGWS